MLPDLDTSNQPAPYRPDSILSPDSNAEPAQVLEQLRRILSSPAFQNSKRYAAVLKYVVEQTLDGAGAKLKERTIGIDIFGRAPDYDTSSDHVVRSAFAEVRKRLAQYYQQPDTAAQLRIEALPGCYTPQFRWPEPSPVPPTAEADSALVAPLSLLAAPISVAAGHKGHLKWILGGLLVVLAGVATLFALAHRPDTLESFWHPFLSSKGPILLCMGNQAASRSKPGADTGLTPPITLEDFHDSYAELVQVDDAITLTKLAGFMEANGKQIRMSSQSDATFTDLQDGPAILIGLMNNSWTKRLVSNLRFTPYQASHNEYMIRDRNNPSSKEWSVNYSTPYLELTRDYAIVLRMVDPKTEQMVVAAAGMTVFGTRAAGDFLTSESEMKKLVAAAPPGWEKKNMEFVLSTDVIRGRSGPANVVAVQCW